MEFSDALGNFRSNVGMVRKMINFDKEIQKISISSIETLNKKLVTDHKITNPQLNGQRTLDILKKLRNSPALKQRYDMIYNQAVVLLVSHFGSAIADIFRRASAECVAKGEGALLEVELKIKIEDILDLGSSPADTVGDLVISKEDISFQDMKSTHRAFKKHFNVTIDAQEELAEIILGQACRHIIVHNSARVNEQTINQLRHIRNRSLKPDLVVGDIVQFEPDEIELLSDAMSSYIDKLVKHTVEALGV